MALRLAGRPIRCEGAMTEAEARSQACRLAEALSGETDPVAVRAALHGLTAQEANRVVRAAAPSAPAPPPLSTEESVMAWHRYRREAPDYSHLAGRTPEQVFAETYARPTFGDSHGEWPARVNRQLIHLFEGRERLHVDEAVAVYGAMFAEPRHTPAFTAYRAANTLHWGVRLGILTEAVEAGRYVWTMPDRQPRWETDSKESPPGPGPARRRAGRP